MKDFFKKNKILIVAFSLIFIISGIIGIGVCISNDNSKVKNANNDNKVSNTIIKENKENIRDDKNISNDNENIDYDVVTKEDNTEEDIYVENEVKNSEKYRIINRQQESINNKINKVEENNTNYYNSKSDESKENETDKKDNEDEKQEEIEREQEIPARFDLREKIDIKVADQKDFGICWDFASIKSVETNLALTQGKYYDFSEIYVDYLTSNLLTSNGRNIHSGGFFTDFLRYNLEFKGFLLEKNLEYREYGSDEYRNFANMELVPINITEIVNFPEYRPNDNLSEDDVDEKLIELQKLVKKHIMNYGSVSVSMTVDNEKETVNMYYHDYTEKGVAHYMSIIGWDDKYPKENFISPNGYTPKRDGAYIVLNSWGEDAGENGYVYVSYEDFEVHTGMTGVVSTSDEKLINLDNIDNDVLVKTIKEKYKKYIIYKNGHSYINKYAVEVLDLSNSGLTSIKGIEVFDNISEIDLSNNNISYISELKELNNLYSLDLSYNKIEDVSVLKNHNNLRILNLENNVDVKGYGKISTLYDLNLKDCNINNLESLDKLEALETLNLSGNNIKTTLDVLVKLKLYNLDLSNCNLQVVPEIDTTNLVELNLSENKKITDYSNLNNININKLILRNCDITDINVLPKNINVYTLDLSENKNVTNFYELANVQALVLNNCNITDVSVFNNMQLNSIDLSNNIGLYGDLNISSLIVNNCNLDDSFNFFDNTEFEYLSVFGNNITLEHIIENSQCKTLRYNDINVEEIYQIPAGTKLKETKIINNLKIPNRDKNIELLPIVRAYTEKGGHLINYSNFEMDEYLLKGKITNTQGKAEFEYVTSDRLENCILIINVIEDGELVVDYINVKNIPETTFKPGDKVDLSDIIVELVYKNGYTEITNDYVIEGDRELHEGENLFTIIKDGIKSTFVINCDGIKTIQFKTTELLNQICELVGKEEIEEINYENKTIVITKQGVINLRDGYFKVNSSMLDDIDSLKDIPLSEIFIEYDGHKINENDIEKLGMFAEVTQLNIINNTSEKNEDIIVIQERFDLNFINQ